MIGPGVSGPFFDSNNPSAPAHTHGSKDSKCKTHPDKREPSCGTRASQKRKSDFKKSISVFLEALKQSWLGFCLDALSIKNFRQI